MGITPLSTPMTMRGKSVLGKTATGIVKARYAPTSVSVTIKNKIGRDSRWNHGTSGFWEDSSARAALSGRSIRAYSLPFLAGLASAGFFSFFLLPALFRASFFSAAGGSIFIFVFFGNAYTPPL